MAMISAIHSRYHGTIGRRAIDRMLQSVAGFSVCRVQANTDTQALANQPADLRSARGRRFARGARVCTARQKRILACQPALTF
jgi:cell division GTPase FtsZ